MTTRTNTRTHSNMKRILLLLSVLAATIAGSSAQETILGSGDMINVKIAGVPANDIAQVSGTYTVSGAGTIRVPYLKKEIQAAGLTPSRLSKTIEAAYKAAEIYTAPAVNINLDTAVSGVVKVISVSGEVRQPGDVPFRAGITMLQAISNRGGFTDFAKYTKVRLIRGSSSTEHNLKNISSNPKLDVVLKPGDRIIVPQAGALFR